MPTYYTKVENGVIPAAIRLKIAAAIEKLDGQWIEIKINKWLGKASDSQRAYWFGVIVKSMVEHCGYDGTDAIDRCHDDLMYLLMPEKRRKRKRITGEIIEARVSWTELTKEETTVLIERAFQYAATEWGLVIQSPKEYLSQ